MAALQFIFFAENTFAVMELCQIELNSSKVSVFEQLLINLCFIDLRAQISGTGKFFRMIGYCFLVSKTPKLLKKFCRKTLRVGKRSFALDLNAKTLIFITSFSRK